MKLLLTLLLTTLISRSSAQEIAGRILDEKKEPVVNASVKVYMGGKYKGVCISDSDGHYTIKRLKPWIYDVRILHDGYDTVMITGGIVNVDRMTTINEILTKSTLERKCIRKVYRVPLVDDGKNAVIVGRCERAVDVIYITDGNYTLTREDLSRLPATHINDYAGFFPGVYQARRGDAPIIYGGGNQYLMDGVIINR